MLAFMPKAFNWKSHVVMEQDCLTSSLLVSHNNGLSGDHFLHDRLTGARLSELTVVVGVDAITCILHRTKWWQTRVFTKQFLLEKLCFPKYDSLEISFEAI